nr:EAL domain-containing protein [Rhizobium sp. L1K21]
MWQALARGEFHLAYQPQVNESGRIFGVEALLRWNHPTRGPISPQEFIPLAEETGMIIPIGEWVLRTACAQLAEWAKVPHKAHLTIAVNVSALQFRQPDFVQQVKQIVSLSGINPSRLELELTESAVAEDSDNVVKKMQALKRHGITWSLDDFGTGYSSLSSLKRLPLDKLKIDQSFVRDLLTDERNIAIVDTIIQLSGNLGLKVIAEGVETEEHLQVLSKAGCKSYQGYLFSRPLPISALDELIGVSSPSQRAEKAGRRHVA